MEQLHKQHTTGFLLSGNAYQSSTFSSCTADKALDGEKEYNDLPCTCSVTAPNESPRWWEMDFGSKHLIDSIVVTGRTDTVEQSLNLAAYISNNTMGPNNECPTGSYGDKCSSNCSQQCIAEECHHVSGICNLGCKPGYDFRIDPKCETLCELCKYGEGCIHDCHCANGNICDGVTGDCAPPECEQGWTGSSCNSHKNDERRFTASEVAGVAGGSVGGCLLLLGLVFASVLVYRRYKSTSTKSDTTNAIPNIDYVNTGRTYEGLFVMPLQNIDGHTYQTIQN
ncbi:multiple epidermal growth factor-like domains protein 10 [Mya arenaria]|uniref:multiple epidermal growth factor-like domains protein 10 n=1 Tax=Mya arenaria TaxID=6604 RepID=UPI0022E65A2E|nr:multiple epidermal growth factor-like domains protein 10 [Mya arenaria]